MRTNLSSQISLNRVSPKYYKPENAVERSVLTRFEKVPTDIYETVDEGVQHIADETLQMLGQLWVAHITLIQNLASKIQFGQHHHRCIRIHQ